MDKNILRELRDLVEQVMFASTKEDAQPALKRLKFMTLVLSDKLDSYLAGKLREVVSYAQEASGQARNKDHWISCMEQCWYVFENGVTRKLHHTIVSKE